MDAGELFRSSLHLCQKIFVHFLMKYENFINFAKRRLMVAMWERDR